MIKANIGITIYTSDCDKHVMEFDNRDICIIYEYLINAINKKLSYNQELSYNTVKEIANDIYGSKHTLRDILNVINDA